MSKPSDEMYTPGWLCKMVVACMGIPDLDPCTCAQAPMPARTKWGIADDGLSRPWPALISIWLNPPYSNPTPWVERIAESDGRPPSMLMVKNDHSTKWWRLVRLMPQIQIHTRVAHERPNGQKSIGGKFATTIFLLGHWSRLDMEQARDIFAMGCMVKGRRVTGTMVQPVGMDGAA